MPADSGHLAVPSPKGKFKPAVDAIRAIVKLKAGRQLGSRGSSTPGASASPAGDYAGLKAFVAQASHASSVLSSQQNSRASSEASNSERGNPPSEDEEDAEVEAEMGSGKVAKTKDSPTIKVCIRCRCFIKEEFANGGAPTLCIRMPTKNKVEIFEHDPQDVQTFDFDRCYWSHNKDDEHYVDQAKMYTDLGKKMLQHSINGFNNCIFAYGQTGTGKSYSVLGASTGPERGLLPRIVQGLFSHFDRISKTSTCRCIVSFVEIYNEQLRDLLAAPSDLAADKLNLRHHPVLGMIIPGLTEAPVEHSEEVMEKIEYGTTLRSVGTTAMNSQSSRSHCIFTFKTSVRDASGQTKFANTHLVDLAGSERAKRSQATGDRLKEGANINHALSTLARVITALANKKSTQAPPFRDSKVTHILKESLCGNSKTVMIAAISPSVADYKETMSTLRFARSVKQVKTRARANTEHQGSLEKQLKNELAELRDQLQKLMHEKAVDAKQLSKAQGSLHAQEMLCSRFSDDWEGLIAAERRRHIHRMAVVNLEFSPEQLENFEDMYKASKEPFSNSSSSSGSSSSSSRRGESFWPSIRNHIDELDYVATKRHATQLTVSLDSLSVEAAEAEEVTNRLSFFPRVRIATILAVNPQDLDLTKPMVIVRRWRPADGASQIASGEVEEFLTAAQLRARVEQLRAVSLQAARAVGGGAAAKDSIPVGVMFDAWAVSKCPEDSSGDCFASLPPAERALAQGAAARLGASCRSFEEARRALRCGLGALRPEAPSWRPPALAQC